MTVWLNGEIVEEARIDAADRGLLLADGAFATFRAVHGRPLFWGAHWERLADALDALGIPLAYTSEQARDAVAALSSALNITDCAMRLTVTRGAGGRGLEPPGPDDLKLTTLITARPLPPQLSAAVAASIVSVRRNEGSPSAKLKTLAYTDNLLALAEARASGAQEALLLNSRGALACASMANVFIISGQGVATPPVDDGCRPGVARALVLEIARELGFSAQERSISPDELHDAFVFATNAVRGPFELSFGAAPDPRFVEMFMQLRGAYDARVHREIDESR